MATNIEIIGDALRELNVINEVQAPSPEQGQQCLRKLNQMMESWKDKSLNLGWFKQTSTTDTAPIPDYAEMAVVKSLAAYIASQYGAQVSAELAATGSDAIKSLRRKLITEGLDNTDMSHMPTGQGHYGYGYDIVSDS